MMHPDGALAPPVAEAEKPLSGGIGVTFDVAGKVPASLPAPPVPYGLASMSTGALRWLLLQARQQALSIDAASKVLTGACTELSQTLCGLATWIEAESVCAKLCQSSRPRSKY